MKSGSLVIKTRIEPLSSSTVCLNLSFHLYFCDSLFSVCAPPSRLEDRRAEGVTVQTDGGEDKPTLPAVVWEVLCTLASAFHVILLFVPQNPRHVSTCGLSYLTCSLPGPHFLWIVPGCLPCKMSSKCHCLSKACSDLTIIIGIPHPRHPSSPCALSFPLVHLSELSFLCTYLPSYVCICAFMTFVPSKL